MTVALLEESRKTISLNHRKKITGGDVLQIDDFQVDIATVIG